MLSLALERVPLVDHHRGALARTEGVEDDRDVGRVVALEVLQDERRAIVLAQKPHQRLQFVVTVRGLDRDVAILELAVLAQDFQKLAHILIRHEGLPLKITNDIRPAGRGQHKIAHARRRRGL